MVVHKRKKLALIAAGVFALACTGLVVLAFFWPAPPLVQLVPLSVEQVDSSDRRRLYWAEEVDVGPGHEILKMELRLHAPTNHPIAFLRQSVEAKVGDHWEKVPKPVFVDYTPWHNEPRPVLILIPKGSKSCRIQISYPHYRSNLPLGIGNPFARYQGSPATLRAQKFVGSISTRLLNWLWGQAPPFPLKTLTVEVNLSDPRHITTVCREQKSWLK